MAAKIERIVEARIVDRRRARQWAAARAFVSAQEVSPRLSYSLEQWKRRAPAQLGFQGSRLSHRRYEVSPTPLDAAVLKTAAPAADAGPSIPGPSATRVRPSTARTPRMGVSGVRQQRSSSPRPRPATASGVGGAAAASRRRSRHCKARRATPPHTRLNAAGTLRRRQQVDLGPTRPRVPRRPYSASGGPHFIVASPRAMQRLSTSRSPADRAAAAAAAAAARRDYRTLRVGTTGTSHMPPKAKSRESGRTPAVQPVPVPRGRGATRLTKRRHKYPPPSSSSLPDDDELLTDAGVAGCMDESGFSMWESSGSPTAVTAALVSASATAAATTARRQKTEVEASVNRPLLGSPPMQVAAPMKVVITQSRNGGWQQKRGGSCRGSSRRRHPKSASKRRAGTAAQKRSGSGTGAKLGAPFEPEGQDTHAINTLLALS